jgi:hypothetical protein
VSKTSLFRSDKFVRYRKRLGCVAEKAFEISPASELRPSEEQFDVFVGLDRRLRGVLLDSFLDRCFTDSGLWKWINETHPKHVQEVLALAAEWSDCIGCVERASAYRSLAGYLKVHEVEINQLRGYDQGDAARKRKLEIEKETDRWLDSVLGSDQSFYEKSIQAFDLVWKELRGRYALKVEGEPRTFSDIFWGLKWGIQQGVRRLFQVRPRDGKGEAH